VQRHVMAEKLHQGVQCNIPIVSFANVSDSDSSECGNDEISPFESISKRMTRSQKKRTKKAKSKVVEE
jgi:hypothetical protein